MFDKFCHEQGIRHQYSAPYTPQQNGVVERKNRTLQEMARAMLHGNNVYKRFWAKAINTACYTINRVYVRPGTKMTPYEICRGKPPNISYFHVFGCICYILNETDQLGKFYSRSDEGIFLGYSTNSMAYRVHNKRTCYLGDAVNVVLDDNQSLFLESVASQNEENRHTSHESKTEEDSYKYDASGSDTAKLEEPSSTQVHRNHSLDDVIGDLNDGRKTRNKQIDF